MRCFEILEMAGSHAPLYHTTTFKNAETIIGDDRLEGRTIQLVDARRGRRRLLKRDEWTRQPVYVFDMKGGRTLKGVSLTRDYEFAMTWKTSQVILVLDQQKLRERFTIIPTDHVKGSRYDYTSPGVGFDRDWMDQAEEFVLGDIAPLPRYLLSVNVRLRDLDRMTLMDRQEHAIIFQHTLLNRVVPRSHRGEYDRPHHLTKYALPSHMDDEGGYYADVRPSDAWNADWSMKD